METQPQQASDELVIQSSSFKLNRSFNDQLQGSALVLKLSFPWVYSSFDRTPWIQCPELIQIDEIVDGESPIMLLDGFEGMSLASLLEQKTPTAEEAITILRQLATAVDYLHACNMVHGALRPSAILVGERMSLRIVDWMVDWNRVPLWFLPEAAEYLSPERLSNATAGPRADQFSFGVIACQLLVGRVPFPGEGLAERLFRQRYGLLDDGIFAKTGFGTHAVFERVFSMYPDDRFDSCSAFLDDLEKTPYQHSYAETRYLDVEDSSVASVDDFQAGLQVEYAASAEPKGGSLTGWWMTAAGFALLAFVLGVADWRTQIQIDKAENLAGQLKMSATATGSLQNGLFQVCNSSPEALDIRELAVAYWDTTRKLRVFTSTAYTADGWTVSPASSQSLSWPPGQKSVWDGSVLLYFARVQQGNKEFVVSGRWDGSAQGCLHLSS
jgi:serine/threonine protein kinase